MNSSEPQPPNSLPRDPQEDSPLPSSIVNAQTLPRADSVQNAQPAYRPSGIRPGGIFGRYRIGRLLGEGGMGAVYLAHDTTLDRPVALKIPQFTGNVEMAAARFLREAQSAASLHHPNICPIYDLGAIDGTHFLAMAFVAGEPLSSRVGSHQPMDPGEASRFVHQTALAMQYAHDKGVIHRDLKPANIMIDDRGEPVVMDFGLARRRDASNLQLTIEGEFMGTPSYMPPEQVAGEVARMGPASDIYSLGVVLYQLLTGVLPFRGDLLALLGQVVADDPPPPSTRRNGLSKRFDAICLKAMAKKPEERWKSMRAMAEVLAPLAGMARDSSPPAIALRVRGTNFAYRPPSILPVVFVGRQKRKPGSPDEGNDFVVRVAGNDPLSARISRRHFELHRTPTGWSVIDRSKIGLTRNGEPLPKDTPVALLDGDELGVADVITLEVQIRSSWPDEGMVQMAMFELAAPAGSGGGKVHIEASVGEMMTVE